MVISYSCFSVIQTSKVLFSLVKVSDSLYFDEPVYLAAHNFNESSCLSYTSWFNRYTSSRTSFCPLEILLIPYI